MKFKSILLIATATVVFASCANDDKDKTKSETEVTNNPETTTTTETKKSVTVEVPAATKTQFEAKYPQTSNVEWYRYDQTLLPEDIQWDWYSWPALDTNDYVVRFNMQNDPYWAWYDENGNWIGTISTINVSGVPDPVSARLKSDFEGYTVTKVKKENDKNRSAYEIDLTKGDDKMKVLVDENGNVMKKKGNVDGTKTKEKNI
jgi:hypothetical protein